MSFTELTDKISIASVRNVANHWNDVRGSRRMPAWSDIQPRAIIKQLPFIWSWKYDIKTDTFVGRLAGERIAQALGGNLGGQEAESFFKGRGGSNIVDRMRRVIEDPCYFFGKGAVFKHTGRIVTGERVVLPLSENGETADGVFGITIYEDPKSTEEDYDYPTAETVEFIDL